MAKGKSAKPRPDGIDAVEAREVLQLLDCNAAPPAETMQKVFRLNMGPCSAACGKGGKGSKDNPCCFHGLLPAENSYRKKGLWQKEPVLGQLGHDPAEDRQKVPGAPAGLRNLGNTCYVNAAMQFLHSLPAFRQALYMLEPHLAEQDIVKQMRDLFIEMHFGPKRYVDPEPFANSLLLDPAIQQDGQEFLKLLLSKLEAVFAHSQRQDVAAVVQGLFQGHLSHVTTCHTCNRPSENSKREVEFYELSLQVAALAPDELVGDNQYFCDYCAAKSDADRRMRLRSLPPYLCLALQRFTYDHETWEKKKVLHKLSIPLRLDMGEVLTDAGLPLPEAAPLGPDKAHVLPGSPNSMYELAAVLIHKGTSASHGHYVAHIKLHDTGTWWRFDDEEAEEMGQQPTTHPGDHGMTAATATAAAAAAASSGAAAAGAADTAAEDAKPAVGKKRGRGGSSAPVSTAKRGRGASKGGRGGGRRAGKKAGKREPWEEDSDADAEAEAATAAAEAVDQEELQMQQAMQLSLAEANGDINMAAYLEQAAAAAGQLGGSSRSKRRADAPSAAGSAKGRGRGRGGRGRGKAAAHPEEPAEPPAAPEEPAAAVPPAVVEQILSANAYFLVYRHCPSGSLQPAQQLEAAAAAVQASAEAAVHAEPEATKPAAASAAAAEPATAVQEQALPPDQQGLPPSLQQQQEQEQKQQQALPEQQSHQEQPPLLQEQQVPLQAMDQNVQAGQQQTGESVKAAEAVKQQQEQQQHLKTSADEGPHSLAIKQQQQQQQQPGVEQPPSGMEQRLPPTAQQLQAQLQELPEAVQQQVAQLHRDFDNACRRFQQRKDEALAAVANRQQEVSSIVDLLPVPEGDSGCVISTTWLEGWVNGEEAPEPIDNSVLLCEHQRLSPLLPAGALKYINDTAWQELTARHRGGPRLSCGDVCVECLRRVLQGLVSSEDLVGLRDQLLAALEEDETNQEVMSAAAFYVSKPWVLGFKRRSTGGGLAGRLDAPTAGITCPHGRLAPEGRSGARRFAVSPETWAMLRRLWPQQVLMEAQARRDKAARAAAKRAATGGLDVAAVADISKDDDVVILDSPQKPKQQQQQEQQDQAGPGSDGDDVCMVDAEPLQQQQQQEQPQGQQQQGATGGRASPEAPEGADAAAAAAAAGPPSGWQLPFPLDGSVPLSERLLLQHLPQFPVANVYDCAECAATLQEAAAGHQEVKHQLEGQKQTLGKLLAGTVHEALEPGVTYCLVPNAWLDTWRKHLHAALSKKLVMPNQLPPVPEPLPQAVRSLLCKCHPECPLLAVPLPDLVNKRGRFSQADPQKDALRVITEREWHLLLLHHSGLQLEEDTAPAAAAAAAMAEQLKPAAVAATRLRRRGSKSAEQQETLAQLQKEEQQQLFAQRIASMAAVDPGFRGIRACLKVAPLLPQEQQQQQQVQQLVLAEPNQELQSQGQQAQQQLANGLQQQQEQGVGSVEQQLQQQQHGQPAAGQGEPQQQQQQHEQVCQANGICNTQQQQSKDGQDEVPKRQQEQQQQQHEVMDAAAAAAVDAARDNSNESVDLTASPPQGQRRSKRRREVAQVDLSSSPCALAATGAGVVVVDLANEPAAGATTTAQAAGSDAGDILIDEMAVDGDPAGLQDAAANASGDEWQPERTAGRGSRTQRQSARRSGLARAAAAGSDAAGGSDSEEPGAIPAAAAALRGWLDTYPGPCEATLQAEAAARRAATLVYDRAELMVELITKEELQAAFAAGPGERRSRRARKNRQPVQASSTDTLATLRLKVFEVLSVHPRNQRLYVRGQLLSGEDDTLAKLEVFPDEEIRVVNSNQVPDDDYTSVFDGVAGKRRAREVETGFKDTALHGSSIPAAVSEVPAADPSGPTSTTPEPQGTNEPTSPAAQQASGV